MRAWYESQQLLRWSLELASRGAAGSGTVQNVDDHSHRCPSKLRHKLFHSLYKCGRGEFVGLFREETEPTDVCLPPGDRHFLILLLVVRHRRCSLTLAIGMADGEPLHSGLLFLIESMAYGRRSSGYNSVMVARHSPHFLFYIPKGTAMLGG